MNIEDYAQAATTDTDFLEWIKDERIVMYDWSLESQGLNISERYNELVQAFEDEKDWE